MRNLSSSLTPQSSRNAELFSMSPRKFLTLSCRELGFRFLVVPSSHSINSSGVSCLQTLQLRLTVPSHCRFGGDPKGVESFTASWSTERQVCPVERVRVFLSCGVYGTQRRISCGLPSRTLQVGGQTRRFHFARYTTINIGTSSCSAIPPLTAITELPNWPRPSPNATKLSKQ